MRLARRDAQREPDPLLVGVVTPPVLEAAPGLEEMFRDAYERLHRPSLSYAERSLSRQEAEDAVADATYKVWRLWKHLRPEQRTDAYFLAAVRSTVRDALRRAGRYVSIDDDEAEPVLMAAAEAAAEEAASPYEDLKAEILDEALRVMPEKRREVMLLIYEHQLSWKEAAEELGLSLGTINNQMYKAGRQLRAAFTRAGFRIRDVRRGQLKSDTGDATHG